MKKKSMLRGQECKPLLSIFSGEIFMYPKKYKKDFLGNQKLHVVAPKYTKYDIDNEDDLKILNAMNIKKMTILKKFIHIK